jgi:hypothetical protein
LSLSLSFSLSLSLSLIRDDQMIMPNIAALM